MKGFLSKLFALFLTVRFQNVIALLLAQLLAAHYIFSPDWPWHILLWNKGFLLLLLATASAVSGGYIINNFYNHRRDLINRPAETMVASGISVEKKLYLYFLLNFISIASAWLISFRAFVFFTVYIFLIWFYSHKLQRKPFVHEISVSFLILYPFFGTMLFFKRWNIFILSGAVLFFITLIIKELIKDFLTLRGDMADRIETGLIYAGEKKIHHLVHILTLTAIIIALMLIFLRFPPVFKYFLAGYIVMLAYINRLFVRKQYDKAYLGIKFVIIAGIIWIIFYR